MTEPDQSDRDDSSYLADSPWFWVCLFGGAALLVLAYMGPKYAERQTGIERRYEARQRIAAGKAQEPVDPAPKPLIVTLRPLVIIFGGLLLMGAAMLIWKHRPRRTSGAPAGDTKHP
jgi:hypothetical protein